MMYAARKPGPTMRVYIDNAAAATTTSTSQRRRASGPTRGEAGRGTAPLLPLITAPFTAPRCKKNLAKDSAPRRRAGADCNKLFHTTRRRERGGKGKRKGGCGNDARTAASPRHSSTTKLHALRFLAQHVHQVTLHTDRDCYKSTQLAPNQK